MTGIYYTLYDIVVSTLYGSSAVLTGWQEMVATFLGSVGAVFVFVIPFAVVWKVIEVIFNWR